VSEQILAAMAALTDNLTDLAKDVKAGIKTQADQKEQLEKLGQQVKDIDNIKQQVKASLPNNAPLDPQNGDAATKAGGFRTLPIKKALEIPATHAMLQGQDRDEVKNLHDYHDAVVIKWHMLKKRTDSTQAWSRLQRDVDFITYKNILVRNGFITEQKANEVMNPDGALVGTGGTLDFTLLSATMIDKLRLNLVVADKFREITLTRATQEFPTRTLDGFGVLGGSTTAAPPTQTMTTGVAPWPTNVHFSYPGFGPNRQFNAKHLLVFLAWNDDMLEDSILPWLPMMREDLSYFAARTLDRAILDGDTTGTHMDYDVTAATDFRKAWYGLRKMSLANWYPQGSTTIDDADLHALRKTLGKYGKEPSRLVYFMALKQYYDLIALGVITTANNLNQPAAALSQTGVLGSYWGIPIAVSEFVRTDTHTDGLNNATPGNNVQSIFGCVNTDHFVRATYGTVQIEETRLAQNLITVLQSDVRMDFGAWDVTTLTSGQWAVATDIPCNFAINCD
jgi:hypothetical protein